MFTSDQFARGEGEPTAGQKPARGVIESKKPGDDIDVTAASEQISRYWKRYSQVLVTNFREFVLIGRDGKGDSTRHEFYRLAYTEQAFRRIRFKLNCSPCQPVFENQLVLVFVIPHLRFERSRLDQPIGRHGGRHPRMSASRESV